MTLTGERKKQYQRDWLKARRDAYFAGKVCALCGSDDELEIDHIDPSTKDPRIKGAGSGAIWSWSSARREAELSKCQALCRPCHKAKTRDQAPRTDHGRGWMYQRYGCRCDLCKAWKLAESQRYGEIRKARKIARVVDRAGLLNR